MVMKLINFQYSRLMALSGLLLCLIVLCAINSQNSVLAQNSKSLTPDLRTFFSDAIFPNSYPSTDFANVDDRPHGSKAGNDAQGPTKAGDETTTAPQVDETTTAPQVDETTTAPQVDETTTASDEVEVTKKRVNEALFDSGIFGLGF
jgi:cytoskeletal protein RodZ